MSARALGVDAGVPAEAAAASACPPVTEARSQAEPASQAATHGPLAPDGGSTPPRHGQCRGGRDSHHTGSVCWRLRGMPGAPGSCLQIEPPGQGDLWERPLQHDPPPPEGRFPGPGPSHGTWHLRILGAGQLWHGLRPLWAFEQAAKDRPAVSHGPPRSQKAAQRLSRRRAGTEAGPGRPSPPMLSELGFETSGLGRHRAQRVQPPLRAPCRRGHRLP